LAWFLIALWIFLFQIAVCGVVHDNERVKAMLLYLDKLPSYFKTFLGGEAVQYGNIAGLISIGYQDPLVLILYMIYAVGVPTALLSGEVQRGTMELILSRQTAKTQIYICAGLITVIGMFALVAVMFLGTVAATRLYNFEQDVPLYTFFMLAINGGILACAVGGIALLAAACFRRGTAVGVAIAYLVANYFAEIFAAWWPRMKWLEPINIYHYVNDTKIFTQSVWPISDMCVLITVLVISTVAGGVIWSRRDLPL
jgi:ABC-2 type transport system permease protein